MKLKLHFTLLLLPFFTLAQLKSPSEFLGYELGTQFTRHHQVVDYYTYLSEAEPERMNLIEYGKTNERRSLLLATISTKANMDNLENIRLEHMKSLTGEGAPDKAIVWLGYNVHGNESVSTEASMQTIYDLLTTKSSYLEETVVLIDPCINPDGRDRYVNWYNQYKNSPNQVDSFSKEHNEGWWSGRSNHYMFDLNRDWAWLTQVESQQRSVEFNKWLPHVLADFHEQGVDNPYYFPPAAEPSHEVLSDFQKEFQVTIGKNNAKYFDENGWFYFTKEIFDGLYPSYGASYPTYNGAIGLTYEQGGSGRAGLGVITGIGDTLTLKDRIAHHLTTGLSTVEVASKNATKLNDEFKKYFQKKNYKYKSYVLNGNPDKLEALANFLSKHDIAYQVGENATIKGYDYNTGKSGSLKSTDKSLVISSDQPKSTLIKVLFEPKMKLADSVTYDNTAWSLPYAYGLDAVASESAVSKTRMPQNDTKYGVIKPDSYAYLADWNSMKDAKFLAELLRNNIRVRYAHKPFTLDGISHGRGTLIITKSDNKNVKNFNSILDSASRNNLKELTATDTGFVESGKDFGSGYVDVIQKLNIAVLSGEPTSTLRFGEIWNFFEQQLNYPVSILDEDYFNRVDLTKYDILILPDGWDYNSFLTKHINEKIKDWVIQGGKLIAMGGAIDGLSSDKDYSIREKEFKKDSTIQLNPFESSNRERIKSAITGAIFKATVDNTNPLAYGYEDTYFTLKLGDRSYNYLENGTAVYLSEGANQPISGFAGSEAKKKIAETLIYGTESMGRGQVIYMVDNPLYRAFWENGKLLFANALFMVK
ncbi:M14 family metallopeptidase [Maribacter hydrothermalis]|uniref:Zinc carboxypeptidase n=1 Tax=Maribacter hydrothermalis TaxID=1836467 RepID=A0A1B7Z5W2_9FLAO|nr:M14 family metallopeptidase [Maribacter hydrothermalis]APQ16370.1 zinc carboxypeptidase [Maribacter hydrothermalis]OBR38093.1 zinc carboxypeptidase [Maribacter hydrothermalis]